jgi:hypothetical protein
MPDKKIVKFGFVIEGKGEVDAVPLLIRRICGESLGVFSVTTSRPVRIPRSKLVRSGELERAIQLAQATIGAEGPVLVLMDADEDAPCVLGPSLKSRALAVAHSHRVSIVIPKFEFETWFLAAAKSLGGLRGLREGLLPPADPESVRGAKEWLSRNMVPGRKYSPSVDQAALVARMDLTEARSCRSFERLCREMKRLLVPC